MEDARTGPGATAGLRLHLEKDSAVILNPGAEH